MSAPTPDPLCDCCDGGGMIDHGASLTVCRCCDVVELTAEVERLRDALSDISVSPDDGEMRERARDALMKS
jgi:hypothetical protein